MKLKLLDGRDHKGYTSFGGCWKKGEVTKNSFRLESENGDRIPVQSQIRAMWPDGSIKWSLHTADSEKMGSMVNLVPEPVPHKTNGINIKKNARGYCVDTGTMSLCIPIPECSKSKLLASDITINGKRAIDEIYPVFCIEHRKTTADNKTDSQTEIRTCKELRGEITKVDVEEDGPLQAVFCFHGIHTPGEYASMPFIIRMYVWYESSEIRFMHTFFFDGEENRDYLKGMGIRAEFRMHGKLYDRHIQFAGDSSPFHEAAVLLYSNNPKLPQEVLCRQLEGTIHSYEADSLVEAVSKRLHIWNRYFMFQENSRSFSIRKQTNANCCLLTCSTGKRAHGVMSVANDEIELLIGIRDFWQRYPSELECDGLAEDSCKCTAWFYSPEAEAYDFRHYSEKSYPDTCYEGFSEIGASAYGIAVTSECRIQLGRGVSTAEEIRSFTQKLQKPAVYTASPEYYHSQRAFGYWSLPEEKNPKEKWLEEQLEKAFLFYKNEVDARDWYGLFDYGDVMHTYDPARHMWRYDVGGMAWQNTELVPTYWLWYYFMRTGREDVFSMAEAMSRHCSETDVYHFGPFKGLGSRHNVRHWGCSCKEVRISMSGHHRFLYYLTGDRRLRDIFEEVKDADCAMVKNPHSQELLADGTSVPSIRSGPDWSSMVSDWMTWYEITLDNTYRKKIEQGIADIAATPFGLASGPDYYYDVERSHLIYHGEVETTPNQHLQICMGGPQVWLETADMLENNTIRELIADLGSFYYLSKEEKAAITDGQIKNRPFSWPMFATGIAAYAAMKKNDHILAKKTWNILFRDLADNGGMDGYASDVYDWTADGTEKMEIPWITTNCTAQWCLNVIMCLEFIRESLTD